MCVGVSRGYVCVCVQSPCKIANLNDSPSGLRGEIYSVTCGVSSIMCAGSLVDLFFWEEQRRFRSSCQDYGWCCPRFLRAGVSVFPRHPSNLPPVRVHPCGLRLLVILSSFLQAAFAGVLRCQGSLKRRQGCMCSASAVESQ